MICVEFYKLREDSLGVCVCVCVCRQCAAGGSDVSNERNVSREGCSRPKGR